jgi:hypothetical protein
MTPEFMATVNAAITKASKLQARSRRMGRESSELKPVTPDQITAFVRLWHDPSINSQCIAERYRVTRRTVVTWAQEFGLIERHQAVKIATDMCAVMGDVAGAGMAMVKSTAAMAAVEAGASRPDIMPPGFTSSWDPMQNQDVIDSLMECRALAAKITTHSDLTALRRRVLRFQMSVALNNPSFSWQTLGMTMEAMNSILIQTQRIEASLPKGDADNAQVRREVANQMMREIAEVLPEDKQQQLAALVKEGAALQIERQRLEREGRA